MAGMSSPSHQAVPPDRRTLASAAAQLSLQPSTLSARVSTMTPTAAANPPQNEQDEWPTQSDKDQFRDQTFEDFMQACAAEQTGGKLTAATGPAEAATAPAEPFAITNTNMQDPHQHAQPELTADQLQLLAPSIHPSAQIPALSPSEQASYSAFLTAQRTRTLQRENLATRDTIWAESIARAQARLGAVRAEAAALEAKIAGMEREREGFRVSESVRVSEVEDAREERRWVEWLRVEKGVVVDVGRTGEEGGEGEGMQGIEEEAGGVDI